MFKCIPLKCVCIIDLCSILFVSNISSFTQNSAPSGESCCGILQYECMDYRFRKYFKSLFL